MAQFSRTGNAETDIKNLFRLGADSGESLSEILYQAFRYAAYYDQTTLHNAIVEASAGYTLNMSESARYIRDHPDLFRMSQPPQQSVPAPQFSGLSLAGSGPPSPRGSVLYTRAASPLASVRGPPSGHSSPRSIAAFSQSTGMPAAVPQTSGSIPQFSTSGSTFSGSSLPPPQTYQQTPLVPPQFTSFQGPATRSAPTSSFGEQYPMTLSPPQDQFGNFQPLFSSTGSPPLATPFTGYATPSRTSPDADLSAQRRTLLSSWAPPTFKK
jgi:hypothetical protein